MMRRIVVLVLFFSACALAKDGIQKRSIKVDRLDRTYYVFAPENLTGPAPLLLLLHGSGAERNGHLMVSMWKDLAIKEGIVLVGPDALDRLNWSTKNDGPLFLDAVIKAVRAAYPVDRKRMYMFGHSGGAVFALIMSLKGGDYFAATAVHAGLIPTSAYNWFDPTIRRIPIKIIVGTNDGSFPLDKVRITLDFLKEKGFPIEVTEIPGHTHDYYSMTNYINERAWQFLKEYSLP